MNLWTKKELLTALKSELLDHTMTQEVAIDEVVIDSRKAEKHKLFIALKGDNHDAHSFLDQVFDNGCHTAIISNKKDFETFKKSSCAQLLLVKDTFKALYKLAEFSRNRSEAEIIGITGSVGKTSMKDMLKKAFATQGTVFATPGNLNNHIGLPLSLTNLHQDFEYGIFEMGMNHPGEIETLSRLTRPNLAIITNVGPVHIENFKDEKAIAKAKAEIFAGLDEEGYALINHDSQHFDFLKQQAQEHGVAAEDILSFGEHEKSYYKLVNHKAKSAYLSNIKAKTQDGFDIAYSLSSANKAMIFNSLAVIACLDLVGSDMDEGIATFKEPLTSNGRGNIIETNCDGKKITIIDETYNASLLSMKAGLEHAMHLKKSLKQKRLIAVLGDMFELGKQAPHIHQDVVDYAQELNVDFSILVGKQMQITAKQLNKNICKSFSDAHNAALNIKDLLKDGDILYIKGSRGMEMEQIIKQLTKK